jgi:hypothetical protein
MEKLLELLNDYKPYIQSDGTHTDNFWWYVSQWHSAVFPKEVWVERIISKEYGFIKRLVDNDKIDFIKVIQKKWHWEIDNIMLSMKEREYLELLMLLAISNEPIEFLISILK